MNELEKQKQIVTLLEHAVFNVKLAASEEQKVSHSVHIDSIYNQCLELLDQKRTYEQVKLTRIELLGK